MKKTVGLIFLQDDGGAQEKEKMSLGDGRQNQHNLRKSWFLQAAVYRLVRTTPTPLAVNRGKTLVTIQVFLVLLHHLRGGILPRNLTFIPI
jgi:hypothetical protein